MTRGKTDEINLSVAVQEAAEMNLSLASGADIVKKRESGEVNTSVAGMIDRLMGWEMAEINLSVAKANG